MRSLIKQNIFAEYDGNSSSVSHSIRSTMLEGISNGSGSGTSMMTGMVAVAHPVSRARARIGAFI